MNQNIIWQNYNLSLDQRVAKNGHKPAVLWFTGLSGSGKSTLANSVINCLFETNKQCFALDGDNIRHGLNQDLDFSDEGRKENIRRISEVAKLLYQAGLIVTTAFISPFREDRELAKQIIGENFFEIYLDTPLSVCEERDPKGLYKKARAGEISHFTGIDSIYEQPLQPDLILKTHELSKDELTEQIISFLQEKQVL